MPPRTRQPGEGQLGFDGSVVPPQRAVNPDRPRNALARTLTPEYMNLDPMEFTDVNQSMVEYVQPDKLREHLIDVPFDVTISPSAVSYTDTQTHRERNIAVSPKEAEILPRFLGSIQRNAALKVGAKITTPVPTDADLARVDRARVHVLESKLPRVENYVEMLRTQRSLLDKFVLASDGSNIGLSMFGKEGTLREKFAYLQTYVIGDMIRAYGAQRKLGESDMKMVEKAVIVSIFFHPNHIANFHGLVKFLREYNGHKLELAGQRVESMTRNIGRQAVRA